MSFWSRPKIEELVIVLAAIIAFIVVVSVRDDGEEPAEAIAPTATATATATPSPSPTPTPPPPPTPSPTTAATAAASPPEPAVADADPDECDFGDVADDVRAAIVRVVSETRSGTAFHIGGGRYITAAHVIQDDFGITSAFISLRTEGSPFRASVEWVGSYSDVRTERDIAVLRAEPIPSALKVRNPTEDDRDIDVRAFGYPWSSVGEAEGDEPLQTSKGVVSALTISDGIEIIQTDADVDRGMSGGPLVDECGYALAVASFVRVSDDEDDPSDFPAFISIAEIENLE